MSLYPGFEMAVILLLLLLSLRVVWKRVIKPALHKPREEPHCDGCSQCAAPKPGGAKEKAP